MVKTEFNPRQMDSRACYLIQKELRIIVLQIFPKFSPLASYRLFQLASPLSHTSEFTSFNRSIRTNCSIMKNMNYSLLVEVDWLDPCLIILSKVAKNAITLPSRFSKDPCMLCPSIIFIWLLKRFYVKL